MKTKYLHNLHLKSLSRIENNIYVQVKIFNPTFRTQRRLQDSFVLDSFKRYFQLLDVR
jgi:hypothetical protein